MERSILKAYKGLNVWYRRFLHFVKMLHSIPLFTPVEKTEVVCTRNTQNILSIVMGKKFGFNYDLLLTRLFDRNKF